MSRKKVVLDLEAHFEMPRRFVALCVAKGVQPERVVAGFMDACVNEDLHVEHFDRSENAV